MPSMDDEFSLTRLFINFIDSSMNLVQLTANPDDVEARGLDVTFTMADDPLNMLDVPSVVFVWRHNEHPERQGSVAFEPVDAAVGRWKVYYPVEMELPGTVTATIEVTRDNRNFAMRLPTITVINEQLDFKSLPEGDTFGMFAAALLQLQKDNAEIEVAITEAKNAARGADESAERAEMAAERANQAADDLAAIRQTTDEIVKDAKEAAETAKQTTDQVAEALKSLTGEETRQANEEERVKAEEERAEYFDELKTRVDDGEFDGATFTPTVSEEGELTWENNKELPNPEPVNIKGPQGEQGDTGPSGATFTPTVSPGGDLSWDNDKGLDNPETVNITGPQGEGLRILDAYASLPELEEAHETGEEGDAYIAGENLYVWGGDGWHDAGPLKGPKGDTGEPAGFGEINATVDEGIGEPSVQAIWDGPNEAKNLTFEFKNLKGKTGDTGAAAGFGEVDATIDGDTGEPSVAVSWDGEDTEKNLHFTFHDLKGEKGDRGEKGDIGEGLKVLGSYDSYEAMTGEHERGDNVGDAYLVKSNYWVWDGEQWQDGGTLKGPKGDTGDAAGFGEISATAQVAEEEPKVTASWEGPNTAKNLTLSFEIPKGEKGDKGDGAKFTKASATVDDTSGNPSVEVKLQDVEGGDQELTLDFKGLKGPQGDRGPMGTVDEAVKKEIALMAHPVGSYYWSSEKTSPEELFGGTWEEIVDKFVYAVSTSSSAGNTGGAATITLTTSQIPSHTHTGPSHSHGLNSHTHTVGAHSHGLNSHTHSTPAHTHTVNSHNHSLNSHTHTMSHTHQVGYHLSTPYNMGSGSVTYRAESLSAYSALGEMNYTSGPASSTTTGKATGSTGNSSPSTASGGSGTTGAASGSTANSTSFNTGAASGNTASSGTGSTGSTGGDSSHDNMPPYITAYCWKRTA